MNCNRLPIDRENWPRRAHFTYYTETLRVGYSLTVELDITRLLAGVRARGLRLYPALIWCAARAVNRNPEFRMCRGEAGAPCYWEVCHPNYTIFHEDDHTFSDMWSEFDDDFMVFYDRVTTDLAAYGGNKGPKAKPGQPPNFFCISCVPWMRFTGYSTFNADGGAAWFPVMLCGQYFEREGKTLLPVSVSVSHAVADGWHTCKLLRDMQEEMDGLAL